MRGVAGQQRSRPGAGEARAREARSRAEPAAREAHVGAHVPGQAQGAEEVVDELLPAGCERPHERAIGVAVAVAVAVAVEAVGRLVDRTVQRDRRAVVERMRDRDLGVGEREPVLGQRQAAQERRRERERVDGGAHVVAESGQGQLRAAEAAADRRRGLEHEHRAARLGERDRRRQAIRPRADDDRIPAVGHRENAPRPTRQAASISAAGGKRLASSSSAMPWANAQAARARSASSPVAR